MGDQPPTNQEDLVPRIGTFLWLLGIFFFILFVASDSARQANFDWFFLGILLILLGFWLRRKVPPPPSAGRFGGVRKMRENMKKRKQERAEKKKAKKK